MTKVLIIEDEPQMRKNMLLILKKEGYDAVGAANGEEGIALARRELPDVILCDVMMPGLDGYEVLAALRRDPATESIPFIFLTAKGERRDVRAGMNQGADDYLAKPVVIADLLAAIKARIDRREQHQRELRPVFESPKPLEVLGLTPREAEVLFWAAQGKMNAEIGIILDASPATVKKHMEHILTKLEVENRAAASLRAMEVLAERAEE
jgi:DNA-binding NarL/FixJ family response regulator